jgi:hypothetical protein
MHERRSLWAAIKSIAGKIGGTNQQANNMRIKLLRSLVRRQPRTRTALEWLQGALWRLPGRPLDIHKLWLIRFEGAPQPSSKMLRGTATVRSGAPTDVDGMSLCEGKKAEVFLRRFDARDFCIVAEADGRIIGYAWFSVAPVYDDLYFGFSFQVPSDSVFGYDGFIIPEYRLTGAWLKFQSFLGLWMKQVGKSAVFAAVEHSNRVSLATHLRFGFEPYATVWVVRILSRRFSVERPVRRR